MTHLTAKRFALHELWGYSGRIIGFALFLAALLVILAAPTLARENAKRAPLNIIPKANVKAASIARRNQDTSDKAVALPQLAPNGATLRRPIRSVAALPGGEGPVQVGVVGPLEESEIGLIDGFGTDLWQKSRMSSVSRILPRLPNHFELKTARGLAIALMLTRAAPPPGLPEGDGFFAQRLNYLLSLGEIMSAQALVEMTGAAKRDAAVARVAAEAALIQGDSKTACNYLGALSRLSLSAAQKDFAVQLRGFCQVKAGDFTAAALTLDLARESGMKDALFMDLLFALTANITPSDDFLRQIHANLNAQANIQADKTAKAKTKNAAKNMQKGKSHKPLTIMQASLLDLAGIELQAAQVIAVPQGFLAKFAKNPKQPLEIRLLLAERGIGTGHIAPSYMQLLAGLVDLAPVAEAGDEALLIGLAAETASQSDKDTSAPSPLAPDVPAIIIRARHLQLVDEWVTPKGQVNTLQTLLQSSLEANVWPVMVQTTAPYLRRLSPDAAKLASVDFVPYIVPALIWLGEYELAQDWLAVLITQQGGLPSARSRNLQGLTRLVTEFAENMPAQNNNKRKNNKKRKTLAQNNIGQGFASDESPSIRGLPPMEASLIGAVLETGTPHEVAYMRSEIALMPLFGYDVPDFLADAVKSKVTNKKLAHTLGEMEAALAKARRGDVIMFALIALEQQAHQGHYHVAAMRRILTALTQIGLAEQAQAIARDLLVLQAAQLVED